MTDNNYFLVGFSVEGIGEVDAIEETIDGETGLIVDNDQISTVLHAKNLKIVSEVETSIPGIVRPVLELEAASDATEEEQENDPDRKIEVEVGRWNGYEKDDFVEITLEILQPLGLDVYISVPHGRV